MNNVIEISSTTNQWQRRMTQQGVPAHTQGVLIRYIENRYDPGSFLTAVLSNDLFGAVWRADRENLQALENICRFIYSDMPADSWGSPERVAGWLDRRA